VPRAAPFNPLGFLELARRLSAHDEAELRTIINRCYYAMHLRARQGLEARGEAFADGADAHADVWRAMKRRNQFTAGDRLSQLFELRIKADYRLGADVSELKVEEAFDNVEYISRALADAWASLPQ